MGFHSHSGRARCRSAVIRPFIVGLTLFGGDGGMAPHAVHVRANVSTGDVSHTGPDGGFWPEGRWQFQFVKSDGSTLDTADRNAMRVTDPVSGSLVYTDQRYGAAPNAAFVFSSAGSYKVRVRYQNRDKVWSDWVESSAITVSANTRTKRYVNGSTGSDANDGTSSGQAKATLNGALSLVTGNDWEIEVADDTTCTSTSVDLTTRTGIWIHRSGDGAAKPTITMKAHYVFNVGDDAVVDGVTLAYDGVSRYSAIAMKTDGANYAFLNVTFGAIASLCEVTSNTNPNGLLFFGCNQTAQVTRYALYCDEFDCIQVIGCDFTGGSDTEHVIRISKNDGAATASKYASIDYTTLDYASDATNKSALRCYIDEHLGVRRSVLARGSVSLGNIDLKVAATDVYGDYCLDGCKVTFDGTSSQFINIFEDTHRVVLRSCLVWKTAAIQSAVITVKNRASGGNAKASGIRILNCSFRNTGVQNNSVLLEDILTVDGTDCVVRGNLFWHDPANWTYNRRLFAPATGWTFQQNVHYDIPLKPDEYDVGGVAYTVTESNSESWGGGNVTESHTLTTDGEPEGAGTDWQTTTTTAQGVFVSLNEVEYATGPAGCWSPA